MIKKNILLIIVICIGFFLPLDVFALEIHNNVNVDYRFYVNGDNGTKNLKFKLYDKTNTINLESNYDDNLGFFYFQEHNTDNLESIIDIYFPELKIIDFVDKFHNARRGNYSLTINERKEIANEFKDLVDENKLLGGKCTHSVFSDYCSAYMTLPLVIENLSTHEKKIVFGAFHISIVHEDWMSYYAEYIYNFSFINNDLDFYATREETVGDGYWLNNDAIRFIRTAMYDYSDDLWIQLNDGPIASSEIFLYNNSFANANNTDLSVPSVIQFNKIDDSNKDFNIEDKVISKIANPKTFNNGVIILFVTLIIVIGSSIFLLRKNNN